MRDDKLYLIHMIECIQPVEKYTSGGHETFLNSELIEDAVVRNLQVMAESSQRISEDLQSRYPNVAWFKIAGFRNVLVHDYLGVDLDKVWAIIERDLPPLKSAISSMLKEMG